MLFLSIYNRGEKVYNRRMNTLEKQVAMQAIADRIIEQNVTPELAQQAIQLVIGDGNLDADIVFIGEAPGKTEDELGLPFMGAAGKLLNEMLEANEMIRSDVYITNVVKYRPPKNRDPSKAEKAEFLPYLLEQIDVIQPKVIMTLGRHSLEHFLPGAVIGDVHGQIFDVTVGGRDLKLAPLYHPSAAMYNGKLRPTLFEDFSRVSLMLK